MSEGNIIDLDEGNRYPDYYPDIRIVYAVMENLPADEKIRYAGGCYSPVNQEPDFADYSTVFDYSDFTDLQEWDWEANPQVTLGITYLLHMVPSTTYYLRGYVQTDKGEYWSNTLEVHSNFMEPLADDPDAYEIPVVFHLFPDEDGTYPVQDYMVEEQIAYANHVFSNYFQIPGQPGYFNLPAQVKTGVRFVPATHTPDGTPLETPGIVHETEPVEVDYQNGHIDEKYIWDMEHALNVWVCHIGNAEQSDGSIIAGYSSLPYFDKDEMLIGCNTYRPGIFTGIFLNVPGMLAANDIQSFAHEAGHFLGLDHVFSEDYCDDTPWYDYNAYTQTTWQGYMDFDRQGNGTDERFISDNIMDYDFGFMTGFTPDQAERIRYTLQHAYFIPGEAGKEAPQVRSAGQKLRFGKPIR